MEDIMPEFVTLEALKDREVINVCDGRRLGNVCDAQFELCSGKLTALIVPGECNFLGISKGDDILIPWSCIERIGDDLIIVKCDGEYMRCPRKKKRFLKL